MQLVLMTLVHFDGASTQIVADFYNEATIPTEPKVLYYELLKK